MPLFSIPRRNAVGFVVWVLFVFLFGREGLAGNGILCGFGGVFIVCVFGFFFFNNQPIKSAEYKDSQITFLSRFQQQHGREKPSMLFRRKLNLKKKVDEIKSSQCCCFHSNDKCAVHICKLQYKCICYFPYKY